MRIQVIYSSYIERKMKFCGLGSTVTVIEEFF